MLPCGFWFVGVVAVSVAEKMTFDERIDSAAKVIMTPSLILIWSFTDPIHPQVIIIIIQKSLLWRVSSTIVMNLSAIKDILLFQYWSPLYRTFLCEHWSNFLLKKYMLLRRLWTYDLCKLTLDFDWSVTAGGPWWYIQLPVLPVWSQHNLWRLLQRSGGAVGHLCSCWPPQTATRRQQEQEIQRPGKWWIN